MKYWIRRIIALLILFLLIYLISSFSCSCLRATNTSFPKQTLCPLDTPERKLAWEALLVKFNQHIQEFPGTSSIVVKDLETDYEFAHQPDRQIAAASLIKLPIMTAYLTAFQEGKISLEECLVVKPENQVGGSGVIWVQPAGTTHNITELITLMITESDNSATNMLIDRIGMDNINQHIQSLGLSASSLARKMLDFKARRKGVENYMSARDAATVVEKLYRHQILTPELCEMGMTILKRTKLRDRIPFWLSPQTIVAHKTGLENNLVHDAGIVYTPHGNYLVSVMTESQAQYRAAKRLSAQIALDTYKYMENINPLPKN